MFRFVWKRSLLPVVIGLWAVVLVFGSGLIAYRLGQLHPADATKTDRADLAVFWESWDLIDKKFYGDSSKVKERVEGSLAGMVASLGDPYTVYLPPSQDDLFRSGLQGSFGGIGAELEIKNGLLTIVAPLENTPAAKANLKPGDIIAKIDDQNTADLNLDDAVMLIRGDPGTTLALTILRQNEESPLEVSLVRDTIVIESVKSSRIANGTVAYIKINQFGSDTSSLLRAELVKAQQEKVKGVVLDLRNNPGGYLTAAIEAIGMVLPDQISSEDTYLKQRTAVREKSKTGDEQISRATNAAVIPDLPLVVLINGGSASASEIFAGAMQDYGRAKLVGEKSFGKGSVQDLVDLSNGGSIKVTIAHWFTPKGSEINGVGIQPDTSIALPADVQPGQDDVQVQEALKILGI